MKLVRIEQNFSICKIPNLDEVDYSGEFYFIGKTDDELSLVCYSSSVPKNVVECDSGWKVLKIEGILDFSLVGIISKITTILAEKGIGVFVVSTFNTDYILVKDYNIDRAIEALSAKGCEFKL